jgi:sugar phosphate isomerase/epimerase
MSPPPEEPWAMHYSQALSEGLTHEEINALYSQHALRVPMVEAVLAWAANSDDPAAIHAEADPVFDVAEAFGAQYVVAVTMDPSIESVEAVAAGFATLCDRAAERDLKISLEFLPWSGIANLSTGWEIVRTAGRPNGGLMIDTWHWFRAGPDEATLRAIPPGKIHILQISDAPAEPQGELLDETMNHRMLPGEGDADLVGLIRILDEMGAHPLVAPEVFSRVLTRLGPEAMAERVGQATRAVLVRARAGSATP